MKRILLSVCLFCTITAVQASDSRVLSHAQVVANSLYHKVHVEDLKRDFHLLVRLPDGYQAEGKSYPVVYLLDGGMLFPMFGAYYRYLQLEELVPEAIIVGISYGTSSFEEGNYRSTDYTAPSKERSYYGGAERFQEVLSSQILPLIEKNYQADAGNRIIFGQSIGGQFVIYSAMTRPDLFAGHIASNPALHRNLEYFMTPRHKAGQFSRLVVLSAKNDDERFLEPRLKWLARWGDGKALPVRLEVSHLDGYGHFSIVTESFRQGLIRTLNP